MKNKFLKSVILFLLAAMLLLTGCNGGNDLEETSNITESTAAETQLGTEMTDFMINGKLLSSLIIVTDDISSVAGELIRTVVKEKTKASVIMKCSLEEFDKFYGNKAHIRILTMPVVGEEYSVADDEVKIFEKNGNLNVIIGSSAITPTAIANYFEKTLLDNPKDLIGYDEMVKLEQNDVLAAALDEYEQKKANILSSANGYTSANVTGSGKCYYISSSEGNDGNDGLSPERAWKTIKKLNSADIPNGSVVLFKRGDEWRLDDYMEATTNTPNWIYIKSKTNVIYSAYGEGAKPVLNGSPHNAAEYGTWTQTDVANVWEYSVIYNNVTDVQNDVGNILFINNGEVVKCGRKLIANCNFTPDFKGTKEGLAANYEFWFNTENCKVYLYYDKGNPAENFDTIEIAVRINTMRVHGGSGVTIDNITFKYGGAHGIETASTSNLKITNCEFTWIGGGVYSYAGSNNGEVARYGNGVELNWGTNTVLVENNYVYQLYDAGLTHQHDSNSPTIGVCKIYDITYKGNVIEKCQYGIEMFVKTSQVEGSYMDGIEITENIILYSGYGFGYDDRDSWGGKWGSGEATHIKGSVSSSVDGKGSVTIENNIFALSRHDVIYLADNTVWDKVPEIRNNTIIQQETGRGIFVTDPQKTPIYDRPLWDADALMNDVNLKGKGNSFITIK